MKTEERASFTQNEFCLRNMISPSFYYELKKQGKGPREMAVGPRAKRISREAEQDWVKEREAEAASSKDAA